MTIAVRRLPVEPARLAAKRFVIGRRRSRPNAFAVIRIPGGRLAALVLGAIDQRDHLVDDLGRDPSATISSRPWSSST